MSEAPFQESWGEWRGGLEMLGLILHFLWSFARSASTMPSAVGRVDSNLSQFCKGVWFPRWRKKPTKVDVSTAHHYLPPPPRNPQKWAPWSSSPFHTGPPGLKCQAQGGSWSQKKNLSVAEICCLRKSKYRTYIPVCVWRRWEKMHNSLIP